MSQIATAGPENSEISYLETFTEGTDQIGLDKIEHATRGFIVRYTEWLERAYFKLEQVVYKKFFLIEHNNEQADSSLIRLTKRVGTIAAVCLIGPPMGLFIAPAVLFGMGSELISRCIRNSEYFYIRGLGSENHGKSSTIMHLNCNMLPGYRPYTQGLLPAGQRLDPLKFLILKEKPDILFLSEIHKTVHCQLFDELDEYFAHFYTNIGLNQGLDFGAGFFIASKDPIIGSPRFIPFKIKGDSIKRGMFLLETQKCWYIYTHLLPGRSEMDREVRSQQLSEILDEVKLTTGDKPALLIGDLNIDQNSSPNEYQAMIDKGFMDPLAFTQDTRWNNHLYADMKQELSEEAEKVGYILQCASQAKIQVKPTILPLYSEKLSTHSPILATVKLESEDVLKHQPSDASNVQEIVKPHLPEEKREQRKLFK